MPKDFNPPVRSNTLSSGIPAPKADLTDQYEPLEVLDADLESTVPSVADRKMIQHDIKTVNTILQNLMAGTVMVSNVSELCNISRTAMQVLSERRRILSSKKNDSEPDRDGFGAVYPLR